MDSKPSRQFPIRPMTALNTPAKVDGVRERLADKSAGYRAAMADPFAVAATAGPREIDIPF